MSMSMPLKNYLDQRHINYDLVSHRHTETSITAAKSAKVPANRMVKGVLLEDDEGYLMAAVPATRQVDLDGIKRHTGRALRMAAEGELPQVINDCQYGAVPALGEAFGIPTVWDERLASEPDLYIEAGDHEELVHLSHDDFVDAMGQRNKAVITH